MKQVHFLRLYLVTIVRRGEQPSKVIPGFQHLYRSLQASGPWLEHPYFLRIVKQQHRWPRGPLPECAAGIAAISAGKQSPIRAFAMTQYHDGIQETGHQRAHQLLGQPLSIKMRQYKITTSHKQEYKEARDS